VPRPPISQASVVSVVLLSLEYYSSIATIVPLIETATPVWAHSYLSSATAESGVTPSNSTIIESKSIPAVLSTSSAFATLPSSSKSSAIYASTTFVIGSVKSSAITSLVITTSIATSVQSSSSCTATALTGSSTSGNYQYPHLIIPVSSSTPNTAAGTSYFGTISTNMSTIFNFDIPSSNSSSTCNLIFLLPLQPGLETST